MCSGTRTEEEVESAAHHPSPHRDAPSEESEVTTEFAGQVQATEVTFTTLHLHNICTAVQIPRINQKVLSPFTDPESRSWEGPKRSAGAQTAISIVGVAKNSPRTATSNMQRRRGRLRGGGDGRVPGRTAPSGSSGGFVHLTHSRLCLQRLREQLSERHNFRPGPFRPEGSDGAGETTESGVGCRGREESRMRAHLPPPLRSGEGATAAKGMPVVRSGRLKAFPRVGPPGRARYGRSIQVPLSRHTCITTCPPIHIFCSGHTRQIAGAQAPGARTL